jgi:hypothetical protein
VAGRPIEGQERPVQGKDEKKQTRKQEEKKLRAIYTLIRTRTRYYQKKNRSEYKSKITL